MRVVALAIVSTAGTVTAVLTGSPEAGIGIILPLLSYLPK
jgi:hypothetical protein